MYNCDEALFAPQAELIGAIVQGAFGGDINLPMVLLGAIIAVVLIRLAMPVMSVAIGIYLPLYLSVPIMAGGIISHVLLSSARLRIDGTLDGEPSKEAEFAIKEVQDKGVLIGAGFIAGESLMGVLLAIFIVAKMDPSSWFGGIGTLSYSLSFLFFAWFVGVFILLSARSLPNKGNLSQDLVFIAADAQRNCVECSLFLNYQSSMRLKNRNEIKSILNTTIKGHTQREVFCREHYGGNEYF